MVETEGSVVILDKSYLFGATQGEIRSLCDSHRVLVTPGLFYELLKEEEPSRSNCFRKFPERDNPVELIDRVGGLLRYEAEKLIPCTPLYDHRLRMVFAFNEHLSRGDYVGPSELWKSMAEERRNIHKMVTGFVECIASIPSWFPDLKDYKPGQSSRVIDELQAELGKDEEVVRSIYRKTHDNRFPRAELVGKEWAHFRHLQLWLIAGLEYIRSYGTSDFSVVSEKVVHTYIDIQYGIFGALAGALATRDEFLGRSFRLVCPKGLLIQ